MKKSEGKRFFLGTFLCFLYKRVPSSLKRWIKTILYLMEGQYYRSLSLRQILKENQDVEIGMYSYGFCFDRYSMDRKTTIGRYCSFANGATAYTHNHPMDHLSTHSFFFNGELGVAKDQEAEHAPLRIGNDVWVGHNAIILPGVEEIGDGAVIGAGAVVTKNVEPFSLVAGNPARHIRYRFDEKTIKLIRESRWWDLSVEELEIDRFTGRFSDSEVEYLSALAIKKANARL
jgi:virginiamycin A acetyltransferase